MTNAQLKVSTGYNENREALNSLILMGWEKKWKVARKGFLKKLTFKSSLDFTDRRNYGALCGMGTSCRHPPQCVQRYSGMRACGVF